MSAIDTPMGRIPTDTLSVCLSFVALYLVYLTILTFYDVYFGPLSKFPGPRFWAVSKVPRILAMINGDDGKTFAEIHERYGPIVRTGPRQLSFATGAQTWRDIYGFKKHGNPHPYKDPMFYGKSLNDVPSIIVADDPTHGRQRKILSHAFSDKALKEQEPLLKRWAVLMTKKLGERADGADKLDMLKYYNCTTFDVMGK